MHALCTAARVFVRLLTYSVLHQQINGSCNNSCETIQQADHEVSSRHRLNSVRSAALHATIVIAKGNVYSMLAECRAESLSVLTLQC